MSATEILLLRHGQSEGNEEGRFGGHGPTPLTGLGRSQADATARVLMREGGLAALVTSDLVRAVQTAEPIAEACGLMVRVEPALRERSVGVFTDLTFAEAEARYPEAFAALMRRDGSVCPPEGETSLECAARAGACFDQVASEFALKRILLVSHAFTINLLLRHVLGMSHDAAHFFQTDNCALHRLRRRRDGGWTVIALNDVRHL